MFNRYFSRKAFLRLGAAIALMTLFFVNTAVVFADEPEKPENLRTYYSEPLGIDDEVAVYHFRACAKVPAVAPLRCTEENKGISKQCVSENKTNKGTIIKGCLKGKPAPPLIPGTTYKQLKQEHIAAFDTSTAKEQCSPKETEIVYAPQWAIAAAGDPKDQLSKPVLGTIVWGGSNSLNTSDPPSTNIIKTVIDNANNANVLPMYQNALCIEWDKVIEGKNEGTNDFARATKEISMDEDLSQQVQKLTQAQQIAEALADQGCNNDNTDSNKMPDLFSSPLKDTPVVSCTAQYRIEGNSGIDIFTKYVGFLYRWAAGIVGIVSVLVIVFSGVQMSMSQGDSAGIDSAKTRIMQSLVGLAILFLASLILYTINPGFFTG